MQKKPESEQIELIGSCLAAFVRAGSLELSLDQIAQQVCISKRMLIHYFGSRENIEERALSLLEERLRMQFAPQQFAADAPLAVVIGALWERATAPESRGVLLLTMEVSARAWNGSARAQRFYAEQQNLWVDLLLRYCADRQKVEDVLQLFQGALHRFLITGDSAPGRESLQRLAAALAQTNP
jgi:AcrR family transcriptional regulator